jgi:hypothetical protein
VAKHLLKPTLRGSAFCKENDSPVLTGIPMTDVPLKLWTDDTGQDIAEYAAMLAGFNLP